MKEVQRYFKVLSWDGYSAYVSRRTWDGLCMGLRLHYSENSVVWTHPGTVGIFVFTDIDTAYAYHTRFSTHTSQVVEVFPLGWQVKPSYVLWGDHLSRYKVLWEVLEGKNDIWSVLDVFKRHGTHDYYDQFQSLWENTICCEGVLVGKRMRDNPYIW